MRTETGPVVYSFGGGFLYLKAAFTPKQYMKRGALGMKPPGSQQDDCPSPFAYVGVRRRLGRFLPLTL